MDLKVIFLTGLTVGGVGCMAVQGGLLASAITSRQEVKGDKTGKLWPVAAFLIAKLAVYTLLGLLLGLFGQALSISDSVRITMQAAAGLYMITVGLNLLNVHPVFRYAVIQPPRFLAKSVRNQAKSANLFAPAFLGAMTIFIPCGTTLAMEALAISTGNPLVGAAIMGVFVLGTSPLFFGLGYLTSILSGSHQQKLFKLAAVLVLYLGIISFNASLVVAGSPVTLQSLWSRVPIEINLGGEGSNSAEPGLPKIVDGVQVVDINVRSGGYDPSDIKIRKGVPVRLNLITHGVYSCARAFRIPSLGVGKNLPAEGSETLEFTPQQEGRIMFSCSMGMYNGFFEVI